VKATDAVKSLEARPSGTPGVWGAERPDSGGQSQLTLGEVLQAAERRFEAAEKARGEISHVGLAAGELHRLVAAAARNLDAHAPHAAGTASGSEPGAWQNAAAHLQEALRQAAGQIGTASEHLGEPAHGRPDRCTRHLALAADALLAGRDLLRSRTAADPRGVLAGRSDWAPVLPARPVAGALTREMARWSCRAGAMAQWLSASGTVHGAAQAALARAGELLWIAEDIIRPAMTADPGAATDRELLMGIPPAAPPDRDVPDRPETAAGLCAGIAVSAERLRSAAFAMPAGAAASAQVSGPAWQRTAMAAAIASDIADSALRALAVRASCLSSCPVDRHRLTAAASASAGARDAWVQAAGCGGS
jgi:hypothetical protein